MLPRFDVQSAQWKCQRSKVFLCTQLRRRLCEVAAHSAESDHGRLKIEGRLGSISIEILLLLRCVLTSLHRLYSAAVEKSACTLLIVCDRTLRRREVDPPPAPTPNFASWAMRAVRAARCSHLASCLSVLTTSGCQTLIVIVGTMWQTPSHLLWRSGKMNTKILFELSDTREQRSTNC